MPDGERRITHYVGDACAGGHTEQEIAARSEELYSKATKPKQEQEPIDLEAALRAARERVEHESVVRIREALRAGDDGPEEHTWPWPAFDLALDQYEVLARAVGAVAACDEMDCYTARGFRVEYEDEAERLAREVLMHSEQEHVT